MDYFDRLMLEYYRVLNNAWKAEIKEAAQTAIRMLTDMPKSERLSEKKLNALMDVINQNLGNDFMAEVAKETKAYVERGLRAGLNDVKSSGKLRVSIGLWGVEDQRLSAQIQQQNMYWIGKHFGSDIQSDFKETLREAINSGYTREMLASSLRQQFSDLGEKGSYYWQGLAEHTALRVREFGRLSGYEKAGAQFYRLVNPMDDRTSDICRALVGENKIYPLNVALEVRDNLLSIDPSIDGLDEAREQIKAVAPWVSEKDVIYDREGNPTGVSGAHTPFPPFHWKCRTQTEIVI